MSTSDDQVWPRVRNGCQHLPARWSEMYREHFDASVSPAAASGLEAIDRLASPESDVSAVALLGPVGAGKSCLAAIAANSIAERLWAREDGYLVALEALQERDASLPYGHPDKDANMIGSGIGRAHANFASARAQRMKQCPRYVSVPMLLGGLKREWHLDKGEPRPWHEMVADVMSSSGLLILDDLAGEKTSEWTNATVFEMVSQRYDSLGRILVTSNLYASQLARAGYHQLISRIADEGIVLEMRSGKDYRQRLRRRLAS